MRRHPAKGQKGRTFAGMSITLGAIIAVAVAVLAANAGAASAHKDTSPTSTPTATSGSISIDASCNGAGGVVGTVSGIASPFPRTFDIYVTDHKPGESTFVEIPGSRVTVTAHSSSISFGPLDVSNVRSGVNTIRVEQTLSTAKSVSFEPCSIPAATATSTATKTPTATNTPVPTATNTPKPTNTVAPTSTSTDTPEPTDTPKPTNTPQCAEGSVDRGEEQQQVCATFTPEPTDTPEPTATNTPDPTSTPRCAEGSVDVGDGEQLCATFTPEPTDTPEPAATNTPDPTSTPQCEQDSVNVVGQDQQVCGVFTSDPTNTPEPRLSTAATSTATPRARKTVVAPTATKTPSGAVEAVVAPPRKPASNVSGLPDTGSGHESGSGTWMLVALIFLGGIVALGGLALTFRHDDE